MALSKTRKQQLAEDLIDLLDKHGLFEEMQVFVNGNRLTDYMPAKTESAQKHNTEKNHTPYWLTEKCPPKDCYANPDLITFTFEGALYEIMNNCPNSKTIQEMNALFEKYNVYMEQGYPWSAALYYI